MGRGRRSGEERTPGGAAPWKQWQLRRALNQKEAALERVQIEERDHHAEGAVSLSQVRAGGKVVGLVTLE